MQPSCPACVLGPGGAAGREGIGKGEVRDGAAVEVLCYAVPGVTRRGGTAPGAGARGRRGCSDARRGEEEDDAADVRARCVSDSGEEEAAGLLG